MRLKFRWLYGVGLAAALAGCQSYDSPFVHKSEDELEAMEAVSEQAHAAFVSGNYASADASLNSLAAEPTVSQPLYELERVSVLLMQGKRTEAHALMLKVREEIETLFDPQSEEKAISIWHGENNKVFKGDSHERATLYAFLALSFMEQGEWEDAERCVKNGLLADSANTKDDRYNSDYALLHYLGYVACMKAGRSNDAVAYRDEMVKVLSGRKLRVDAQSNAASLLSDVSLPDAFLVVWAGNPPSYVRGGEYEEIRHVVRGFTPYTFLTLDFGTAGEYMAPKWLADINYQATTRGGREMDTVLAHKAAVKKGMETSRNIFLVAGYACVTTVSDNLAAEAIILGTGCTCLAIGGAFHLAGACMNSKADIRSWRNLPGELYVIPVWTKGAKARVCVRGYRLWDNVVSETAILDVKPGAIMTTHCSLLPYGNPGTIVLEGLKASVDAAEKAGKSDALRMAYEIMQ